jgi:hypothetical protein
MTKQLQPWAKATKEALPAEIKQMIADANLDLYYGSSGTSEEYPGFTTACKKIKEALSDIPSTLWVDTQCDNWTDTEPNFFEEYAYDDFVVFDRSDLITALVGKELAPYVK